MTHDEVERSARAVVAAWRAPGDGTLEGVMAHMRGLADALAALERALQALDRAQGARDGAPVPHPRTDE